MWIKFLTIVLFKLTIGYQFLKNMKMDLEI